MQVPSDLVYHRKSNQLEILYATGQRFLLPAEYLRVMSPSAEVQGHSPEERKLQVGKRDVTIVGVEPVGSYAVKFIFSDGHNSGYYEWDYLYQLACDQIQNWQNYLRELQSVGASRDPDDPRNEPFKLKPRKACHR